MEVQEGQGTWENLDFKRELEIIQFFALKTLDNFQKDRYNK